MVTAQTAAPVVYVPEYIIGGLYAVNPEGNNTFSFPNGVATDSHGNIIVADTQHYQIQVFDPTGTTRLASYGRPDFTGPVTEHTHSGSGCYIYPYDATGVPIPTPGIALTHTDCFANPYGVAVDAQDRIYVTDMDNHRVVVLDSAAHADANKKLQFLTAFGSVGGTFEQDSFAGGVTDLPLHDGDFNGPNGIAVNLTTDRVYVLDQNNRVQAFDRQANGTYTFALKFGGPGYGEEPGNFDFGQGLAVDQGNGNLAVADTYNHRVQVFRPPFTGPANGLILTIGAVDGGGHATSGNGRGEFDSPWGIAVDASHRIWVADTGNNRIQVFDSSCTAPCLPLFEVQGTMYIGLNGPTGVVVDDARGRLLIGDTGDHIVQSYREAKLVLTIDSLATSATIGQPDIDALVTVSNPSTVPLSDVQPTATTNASLLVVQPLPAPVALAPGASHQFTVRLKPIAQTPSTTIAFGAQGTYDFSHVTVAAPVVTSAPLAIAAGATPAIGVTITSDRAKVQTGGAIVLHVMVRNTGGVDLNHVLPIVSIASATGATAAGPLQPVVEFACAAPVAANPCFPTNATRTWDLQYTAGATLGDVTFTASATAVDASQPANPITVPSPAFTSVTVLNDVTAPSTTAVPDRQVNASGYYSGPVTLNLTATDDAGGSGIARIKYRVTPGLPFDLDLPATGGPVQFTRPVTLADDGIITVKYFAVDMAGNVEAAHTDQFRIDTQPPTVGFLTPVPAAAGGWNRTPVTIPLAVQDTLSGVASLTFGAIDVMASHAITLSSEGAAVQGTVVTRDPAGNTASYTSPALKIDRTPPVIVASQVPQPNAQGWNNTPVTVTWTVTDPAPAFVAPPAGVATGFLQASGIDPVTQPNPMSFTVNANGIVPVTGGVCDVAGNCATGTLIVKGKPAAVQVDTIAPEGYNQFDPVTKDSFVYARDNLSSVTTAPIAAMRLPVIWGSDDDGDDDGHDCDGAEAELRTYLISDAAGNLTTLVEKVKRDGHEVHVSVIGFTYATGCPVRCTVTKGVVPSGTTKKFEWSTNRDGSLKELQQNMTIGRGSDRIRVEAKFDAKKNQTTVKRTGKNGFSTTLPGLGLLRLATNGGGLAIEYNATVISK